MLEWFIYRLHELVEIDFFEHFFAGFSKILNFCIVFIRNDTVVVIDEEHKFLVESIIRPNIVLVFDSLNSLGESFECILIYFIVLSL